MIPTCAGKRAGSRLQSGRFLATVMLMPERRESSDARAVRVRSRLTTAVRELLSQTPIHAITVADVLRRAGVSRPSFYRHFTDLDDVALTIFREDIQQVLATTVAPGLHETQVPPRVLALAAFADEHRAVFAHLRGAAVYWQALDEIREALRPPTRDFAALLLSAESPPPSGRRRDLLAALLRGSLIESIRERLEADDRPLGHGPRQSPEAWAEDLWASTVRLLDDRGPGPRNTDG